MNFELKKILWAEDALPSQPQTMSLRYRKEADPDEEASYILLSDNLLVLETGAVVNAPEIKGLAENTSYVFRLASYADETRMLDVVYTTPDEEVVNEPEELYYTNSWVDINGDETNFVDLYCSDAGDYFPLRNTWSSAKGRSGYFQNNSQVFTKVIGNDFGFYVPSKEGEMYNDGLNLKKLTTYNARNYYGFSIEFYMAAADNTGTGKFPLVSCMNQNGVGVFVYVDLSTKKVYWEHNSASLKETLESVGTVNYNEWNHVAVFYPMASESVGCMLYLNGDNSNTGTMGTNNPVDDPSNTAVLNIGTTQFNKSANAGKGTFRNFVVNYKPTVAVMGGVIAPPKLDIIMTSLDGNATRYVIPKVKVVSHQYGRMTFCIPENIPGGTYELVVEYGDQVTAGREINVQGFDKVREAKVIDFITDTDPVGDFRNSFYVMRYGSDNPEGGVATENVYIRNGMLTLEAHGEGYTGGLQGLTSYGDPKTHDTRDDPKYGQFWVERVGAGVVSKDYFGYGSFRIQARLPKEFGVVPTFFVSHKSITMDQEPFANELLGKGMRKNYGNEYDGIYIDMLQEFSMQMPTTDSHNTFETVDDLLNYGWVRPVYLLGLDVLRIAITNDPDPANNGTWELTNATDIKQITGWTKISTTPHLYTQPFNNYVKVTNRLNKTGTGKGITAEPADLDAFTAYMLPPAGVNLWDGEFHEFRMDWSSSGVEYYIDGVMIRRNNQMLPWIPGRFGMALLFSTPPNDDIWWKVDESSLWQGKAPWHHQHMDIRRIEYIPSAGTNRLIGETFPLTGLKAY